MYYLVEEYFPSSMRLSTAYIIEATSAPVAYNNFYDITKCKDQCDAEKKLAESYKVIELGEHDMCHSTNVPDRNCKYCKEANWEDRS